MEDNKEYLFSTDKIISFINNLRDEYKVQKKDLSLARKNYFLKLDILDKKIIKGEKEKRDNKIVFSPYGQEYKNTLEETQEEINRIKKEIIDTDAKIDKLDEDIRYLSEIGNIINSIKRYEWPTFINKEMLGTDLGIYILKIQEKERQRISMDLHDSTVQTLTGMLHKIELISRLMDIDIVRAKLELSTLSKSIKDVINEMRDIIFDLCPIPLENITLIDTIKSLANSLSENSDINISVKNENDEPENIDQIVKITLFRVIQEAFTNGIKHSKADEIKVNIKYYEDLISIVIEDDGVGFDREVQQQEALCKKTSFGLFFMQKGIYLLSGEIKVQSAINEGTKIFIEVPL